MRHFECPLKPDVKRENPGHVFGTSKAGLNPSICWLARVLTVGIIKHGPCFEICRGKIDMFQWWTEYRSLIRFTVCH